MIDIHSNLDTLIQGLLNKDQRSLAKLISHIEDHPESRLDALSKISKHTTKALKSGITGPPGAGKSTLTNQLIKYYRKQNKSVAVLAVDPSSPFTGGAILGDRIRMQDHNEDFEVFMRSLGSRGSQGGMSQAAQSVLTLFEGFGFDVILVESVGVGQTEVDIMDLVDVTAVVLVPESGDTIQTMKAGLMEIADVFVVNKADREGAGKIYSELKLLEDVSGETIPVFKTVATKGEGIQELCEGMAQLDCSQTWTDQNSLKVLRHAFQLACDAKWAEWEQSPDYQKVLKEVKSSSDLYELSITLKQRFFHDD